LTPLASTHQTIGRLQSGECEPQRRANNKTSRQTGANARFSRQFQSTIDSNHRRQYITTIEIRIEQRSNVENRCDKTVAGQNHTQKKKTKTTEHENCDKTRAKHSHNRRK
jgi:hypothetical protein